MRGNLGVILRLSAFAIEATCAISVMLLKDRGQTVGGTPVINLLYVGFGVGFVVWIAGMIATRSEARRPRDD